ncbi:MAG TPA: hypothetical protein PK748_07460 [Acidimicrobiales bacterium]|jgi:hypothetical protein|nr:hypothetical protein [Acidimicrobiales bacterium]HRA34748.1 hypothetical protein [Acidimicrobiales bacterium]
MVKSASKFLFTLAAFGFVSAVVYGGATAGQGFGMDAVLGPLTFGYKGYVGDHVGYAIFMGLAITSLFLGVFLSTLRDADPEAGAQVLGLETVPEVPVPARPNYWPVAGAFSAGALVLGLAVGPALFVLGMVGLAVVTVEWAARAWADRATGDAEVNQTIRDRFMRPVEIPGAALLIVGILVLAVSRILLALPKTGSYLVFGLVPAVILGLGALVALRPRLSQSAIAGMLLAGGIAILGGGVAAAIAGEREHEAGHSEPAEQETETEEGLAPLPAVGTVRVAN